MSSGLCGVSSLGSNCTLGRRQRRAALISGTLPERTDKRDAAGGGICRKQRGGTTQTPLSGDPLRGGGGGVLTASGRLRPCFLTGEVIGVRMQCERRYRFILSDCLV